MLYEMGYAVQLIEEKIGVGASAVIAPDLVAYSDTHSHAIVVDCKSGIGIKPHQDGLYAMPTKSDLKPWIATKGSKLAMHTACYVVYSDNHQKLARQTQLFFIAFGKTLKGRRKFGCEPLDKALCSGLSLKGMREPGGHYPFSDADKMSDTAPCVLSGIMSIVRKPSGRTPLDLSRPDTARLDLNAVHPYHTRQGQKQKSVLIKKR